MNQNLAILPKPRIIPPKPQPSKDPPLKQRPASAKRMTIIFGILQTDGILFAADTEETGEHMRFSTPKLYSYRRDSGECLIIGGAGSPSSVETLEQRLGKSFVADPGTFEEIAAEIIKQYHCDHVPDHPENDFWLIFGGSFKAGNDNYRHLLWISEHGEVRDVPTIAAIGAGKEIARDLLKKYANLCSGPSADLAAIHTLRLVKEQAHYCGKESMIWSLSGPDIVKLSDRRIRRAEELSRQIDVLNGFVFNALFGGDASLRIVTTKLTNLRAQFATLVSELESDYAIEKDIDGYLRDMPEA